VGPSIPADVRSAPSLPAQYVRLAAYGKLRICERFGQRPEWFDGQSPGVAAVLIEYERIREAEEALDDQRRL